MCGASPRRTIQHGTVNEYSNYGCRCDLCREAQHQANVLKMRGHCPRCGSPAWNVTRGQDEHVCSNCRREIQFKQRKPLVHGTPYAYRQGCRCEPCRLESNADRNRRRKEQAARGDIQHGGTTGYSLGCRCDACKEANTVYRRKIRAAKRGETLPAVSPTPELAVVVPTFAERGEGTSLVEVVTQLMKGSE